MNLKKLLALILALMMVLSSLPMAFAEAISEAVDEEVLEVEYDLGGEGLSLDVEEEPVVEEEEQIDLADATAAEDVASDEETIETDAALDYYELQPGLDGGVYTCDFTWNDEALEGIRLSVLLGLVDIADSEGTPVADKERVVDALIDSIENLSVESSDPGKLAVEQVSTLVGSGTLDAHYEYDWLITPAAEFVANEESEPVVLTLTTKNNLDEDVVFMITFNRATQYFFAINSFMNPYLTLADALASADGGDAIILMDDYTVGQIDPQEFVEKQNGNFTLNLGRYTLNMNGQPLTVYGNTGSNAGLTLTAEEGGAFFGDISVDGEAETVLTIADEDVTVFGHISAAKKGKVEISAGTYSEEPDEDFIVDGYVAVPVDDMWVVTREYPIKYYIWDDTEEDYVLLEGVTGTYNELAAEDTALVDLFALEDYEYDPEAYDFDGWYNYSEIFRDEEGFTIETAVIPAGTKVDELQTEGEELDTAIVFYGEMSPYFAEVNGEKYVDPDDAWEAALNTGAVMTILNNANFDRPFEMTGGDVVKLALGEEMLAVWQEEIAETAEEGADLDALLADRIVATYISYAPGYSVTYNKDYPTSSDSVTVECGSSVAGVVFVTEIGDEPNEGETRTENYDLFFNPTPYDEDEAMNYALNVALKDKVTFDDVEWTPLYLNVIADVSLNDEVTVNPVNHVLWISGIDHIAMSNKAKIIVGDEAVLFIDSSRPMGSIVGTTDKSYLSINDESEFAGRYVWNPDEEIWVKMNAEAWLYKLDKDGNREYVDSFLTVQDAVNAAEEGQIVVLQQDAYTGDGIYIDKSITLDLNGKRLNSDANNTVYVTGGAEAVVMNGNLYNDNESVNSCTVFVDSGSLELVDVTVATATLYAAGTTANGKLIVEFSEDDDGNKIPNNTYIIGQLKVVDASITDGYFTDPDVKDLLEKEYVAVNEGVEEEPLYHVVPAVAFIESTEVGYNTLEEAFAAAEDGDYIYLLADCTLTKKIEVAEKTVTLEMEGFDISGGLVLFELTNEAGLTIIGDADDPETKNVNEASVIKGQLRVTDGALVIDGGIIDGNGTISNSVLLTKGSLTMSNATVTGAKTAAICVDDGAEENSVSITLTGDNVITGNPVALNATSKGLGFLSIDSGTYGRIVPSARFTDKIVAWGNEDFDGENADEAVGGISGGFFTEAIPDSWTVPGKASTAEKYDEGDHKNYYEVTDAYSVFYYKWERGTEIPEGATEAPINYATPVAFTDNDGHYTKKVVTTEKLAKPNEWQAFEERGFVCWTDAEVNAETEAADDFFAEADERGEVELSGDVSLYQWFDAPAAYIRTKATDDTADYKYEYFDKATTALETWNAQDGVELHYFYGEDRDDIQITGADVKKLAADKAIEYVDGIMGNVENTGDVGEVRFEIVVNPVVPTETLQVKDTWEARFEAVAYNKTGTQMTNEPTVIDTADLAEDATLNFYLPLSEDQFFRFVGRNESAQVALIQSADAAGEEFIADIPAMKAGKFVEDDQPIMAIAVTGMKTLGFFKATDAVAVVTDADGKLVDRYNTLAAAIEAANAAKGSTLTLLKRIVFTDDTTAVLPKVTGTFTLDLNGQLVINNAEDVRLTVAPAATDAPAVPNTLTITDSTASEEDHNFGGLIREVVTAGGKLVLKNGYVTSITQKSGDVTIEGGGTSSVFADTDAGNLNITGGVISGNYDVAFDAPLMIRQNSNAKVTISGGTFRNPRGFAILNGSTKPIEISGGLFAGGYEESDDDIVTVNDSSFEISGGYFAHPVDIENCAEGYYPSSSNDHYGYNEETHEDENYRFTVIQNPVAMLSYENTYPAEIPDFYYAGLNDALDQWKTLHAPFDATIKMLKDDPNAVQTEIYGYNPLTIDLNGKKVTFRALTEEDLTEEGDKLPEYKFGLFTYGSVMITDTTEITTEERKYGSIIGTDLDTLILNVSELIVEHAQLVNRNGESVIDSYNGYLNIGPYTTIDGGQYAVKVNDSYLAIGIGPDDDPELFAQLPEHQGIKLSASEAALYIYNDGDYGPEEESLNVRFGVFDAEEPIKVVAPVEGEGEEESVVDDETVTGFVYGGFFTNIIPNRFVYGYVPGFFDGVYDVDQVVATYGDAETVKICATEKDENKQLGLKVYSLKGEQLVVLNAGKDEEHGKGKFTYTYTDDEGNEQTIEPEMIAFGVPQGEKAFVEGLRDPILPVMADMNLKNDQWVEYQTADFESKKTKEDADVLFDLDKDTVVASKYLMAQYDENTYTVKVQVDAADFTEDKNYTKYLKTDLGITRTYADGVLTFTGVPYGFAIDQLVLLKELDVDANEETQHNDWTFNAELTREFYEVVGWKVLNVEVAEGEEAPVTYAVAEAYLDDENTMTVEPVWLGAERVITMENGNGDVINTYIGRYGDVYDVDTLNNILAGTLDFDSYDAMIDAIGNDGMDYIYRVDKLDDEFNENHTLNIDQPFEPAVEEIELTEDLTYNLNWIETYPINFVEVDEEDEENFWEIGETVRYTELMTVADIIVPDVQDYYDPTSQLQSWLDENGEVYDFEAHAEDPITGAMTFTLCITDAEARIGDQPYATLAEAVEAAEEGDVIELLTPSKEGYTLKDADDAVTVKLAGVDPETGDPLTADDANITAPEGSMVIATADEEDDSLITFTSAEEKVIIKSRSAEFKGQISLALKYKIDDDLLNRDDIYVVFSNGDTEMKRMLLSDFSAQHLFPTDADDEYWYLCPIIIKQFTDEITAKVVKVVDGKDVPVKCVNEAGDKDFTTTGYKYSIEQYLNNQRNGNGPMSKFAQAAYDYGVAAQIKFAYGTHMSEEVSDAVKAVEASDLAETITDGQKPDGVKASINVNFSSDNSLYVYFTLPEGKTLDDYLWSMDDEAVAPVPSEDGKANKYQYKVPNVAAKNLSDPHTFSITDKVDSSVIFTVETSCIGYARTSIQSKTSAEDMKNLARALYLYNETAIAYFGGNE